MFLELRAPDDKDYRATINYYLDSGQITHRGQKDFKAKTAAESLRLAKEWIVKKLDSKLNIDWCICCQIGIELEGH